MKRNRAFHVGQLGETESVFTSEAVPYDVQFRSWRGIDILAMPTVLTTRTKIFGEERIKEAHDLRWIVT